jgi:hypothetical protein
VAARKRRHLMGQSKPVLHAQGQIELQLAVFLAEQRDDLASGSCAHRTRIIVFVKSAGPGKLFVPVTDVVG